MTFQLFHGDCLDVMPTLEAGSFDLIATDPPYGKRFHDGGLGGIPSAKWATPGDPVFKGVRIIGDDRPDTRACYEMARVLKQGGAIYLFTQWMVENAWVVALRNSGLVVRNRMIWVKPFHGAGDLQTTYGPQHESVLYATKGRHVLKGKRTGDIWIEPIGSNGCFRKGKQHPNEKPVSLLTLLIEKSSCAGSIVLDPYMGSGTTGVACQQTGRSFVGIEKDAKYFEIAKRRIETAQLPLLATG